MRNSINVIVVLSLAFLLLSCAGMTRTEQGTLIGAGSGAVIGGIIGEEKGNTAAGVVIGGIAGGIVGAVIGNYMDQQAADIERDIAGATVQRTGENLHVGFASGILFDAGDATLKPQATTSLLKFAQILKQYPDTNIMIEGHTDSTERNAVQLSLQRSQSVVNYLAGYGVGPGRFIMKGHGASKPVDFSNTLAGRQQNRRVDLTIVPDDTLRERDRAGGY